MALPNYQRQIRRRVEINKHTQILLTKLCTPKPSRFFCFRKWFDKVKKMITFVFRMFAMFDKSNVAVTNASTHRFKC